MTKDQVAVALQEVATLLEVRGENPFKVTAYLNAARAIEQLDEDLATVVAEQRLGTIRGVGATLRDAITDLVHTGSYSLLDKLRAETPAGLIQMLRLPGVGPKKVKALHDAGISDLAALKAACESGQVAQLKGFGGKTQDKILAGIAFVEQAGLRIRIDEATALADAVLAALRAVPGVVRAEACG